MENQPYHLHKNLAYCAHPHERQCLDLYLPLAGTGPFPVLIWFHGGGFMRGTKEPGPKNQIPLAYLEKGFAVAAVGYRLSPDVRFPAAIHDAKAAVAWLRQRADTYRLDTRQFVAWGHSAGGYLSVMVGLTAWCPHLLGGDYDPLATQVSGVISESGPIDFLRMDDQKEPDGLPHNTAGSSESVFMGSPIQEVPDLVKTANPIHYLNPAFVPRFLVFHGKQDKHIPYQQSLELVDALKQSGASVDWQLLPNAGHFDIDRSGNSAIIDAFLAESHRPQKPTPAASF